MKKMGEKSDIFVFDTETTGISQRAEIISFAGILLDGVSLQEKDRFCSYIRPSTPEILETAEAKQALQINKIDPQKLLRAPTKIEFAKCWWELRKEHRKIWTPSGYNIGNFDLPKLRYFFWQIRNETPQFSIEDFFHYHTLDLMPVFAAENWFGGKSAYIRLKDACKVYGITNKNAHNALADTEATVELLRMMLLKGERASQGS